MKTMQRKNGIIETYQGQEQVTLSEFSTESQGEPLVWRHSQFLERYRCNELLCGQLINILQPFQVAYYEDLPIVSLYKI